MRRVGPGVVLVRYNYNLSAVVVKTVIVHSYKAYIVSNNVQKTVEVFEGYFTRRPKYSTTREV